jgi:hypothetical protein
MSRRLSTSLVSAVAHYQYLLSNILLTSYCSKSFLFLFVSFFTIHNDDDNDGHRPMSPPRNWTHHNNPIERNRMNNLNGGRNVAITSTPWSPTDTVASTVSSALTMSKEITRHPTWRYSWRTPLGTAR